MKSLWKCQCASADNDIEYVDHTRLSMGNRFGFPSRAKSSRATLTPCEKVASTFFVCTEPPVERISAKEENLNLEKGEVLQRDPSFYSQ